ncbi:hypothetical protein GGR56DRAFT_668827 [Xylariaceae sp. FL0804]|nr:hypothetical protein GGR56DRAFT_668827 [Xylariaceae sp. FL0804]
MAAYLMTLEPEMKHQFEDFFNRKLDGVVQDHTKTKERVRRVRHQSEDLNEKVEAFPATADAVIDEDRYAVLVVAQVIVLGIQVADAISEGLNRGGCVLQALPQLFTILWLRGHLSRLVAQKSLDLAHGDLQQPVNIAIDANEHFKLTDFSLHRSHGKAVAVGAIASIVYYTTRCHEPYQGPDQEFDGDATDLLKQKILPVLAKDDVLDQLIASRKPIAARTKVATAFEAYYNTGGVQKASALAQKRYQVEMDHNVPPEDIARYEVGGSIAVLAAVNENGITVIGTLDIMTLRERCALLLPPYQEQQQQQRLLKKGAILQMPSRVVHQDTRLWGAADAAAFRPPAPLLT